MNKRELGVLLESKLVETADIILLSRWAYQIYADNIRHIDGYLQDVLLDISRMEDATEFEYSLDELKKLAAELKNSIE